ncbi:MAG: sigma-54-dependent transcriptional regulator [Myxococcota bacterium]
MPRVLVVDDEAGVRESLRMLLKADFDVAAVADVDAALETVGESAPDLILLDLIMPGRGGLDMLAELQEMGCPAPVVVLTATKTVSTAVEAMKRGATDYITKPFEPDALRIKVQQLIRHHRLEQEVVRLRDEVEDRRRLRDLIGRSTGMHEVFRSIERLARTRASVLITGESGTGKELAAKAIHELSPRTDGPFVAINCGAIPHNLIESELFGHEKGAFTDAHDRRIGRFEAASGGTLFLDEIGELAPAVQVKLLRALQERVIERLGGRSPIEIDVRVLAATNRDLDAEVAAGRFRADLFYRINVVPLVMPPLRERREDIALLAEHFLERATREGERRATLAPETVDALERYTWPGNVRELENAIEHGLAMCEGERIEPGDLPRAVGRAGEAEQLRDQWRSGHLGFEDTVARFESQLLREALERRDWNQTRAAADLGITRRVLKLKMDKFDLAGPGDRDD